MGVTDESGQQAPTRNLPSTSSRQRHWWRWILASVVVLGIAIVLLLVQSLAGPTIPALTLPQLNATAAVATSAPIDGTWTVGKGSSAGYRVPEAFLWQHGTLVARTSAVTGTFVVARAEVSSAALSVDLRTVKASGKTPSGLAGILDTAAHPDAVFTLTKPIVLDSEPGINKTFTANATGSLAMHGTTRLVTFVVTARDSGSELEATGSIPIRFSEWNIKAPFAIQRQGIAEFLLVMHHQGV
jgi:polyisoprenoid-binding protein YceI